MSDKKIRVVDKTYPPKYSAIENDVLDCKKKMRDSRQNLAELKCKAIEYMTNQFIHGAVEWVPYLYEQLIHGIMDIPNFVETGEDYQIRGLSRGFEDACKKILSEHTGLTNACKERINIMIKITSCAGKGIARCDIFEYKPFDILGVEKTGVFDLYECIVTPYEELLITSKRYLPEKGLNYSYYMMMNSLAKSEEEKYYWQLKLKIARGEIEEFAPGPLSSRPDLVADLEKSRRWDLFCVHEAEMNRQQAASLLLCARAKCADCSFFKEEFPIDLFKIIFVLAGLAWSEEEKQKLRARSYYRLMGK